MIDVSNIESLVVALSEDTTDPVINFNLGLEYDRLGQTSSAAYFYLRAAEYGHETHPVIAYTGLLRMAMCFTKQTNRENTVISSLMHAVTLLPNRPEAHFLLAQYYERKTRWQECYMQASIGVMCAINSYGNPLPADVGYLGVDSLLFEKAVAGWWLGQRKESKRIFDELSQKDLPAEYKNAITNNLKLFG